MLQRHRTIERPRLLALLDAATARVRMLVAPAGYGKTTLAEQWAARDGRRNAWFTARRSATDVAALALGIARTSSALVPECDARLREHLRAVPASAENAPLLAELLGEDLQAWPSDGWLVVDDYHEIARGAESERFVAELIANAPVQVLIAGRQRPSWVSTRGILYGEVLELNQTALAMDAVEAAEILSDHSLRSAAGLVAIANGWPAVIGLASVSGAELDQEVEQVPESLYGFFAEEVYSALGRDVQTGLATLAIPPILDRDLAVKLLGADLAEATCTAGIDVGVIAERGEQLELHPLCRSFLEERGTQLGLAQDDDTVAVCVDHFHGERDWDAAFELVAKHGPAQRLESLLPDALDELLDGARLATIDAWCDLATQSKLAHPIFLVARAESTVRRGRYAEAQAAAEAAAEMGSEFTFRALSVAGRAAHLASCEEEARALYERAELAASSDSERRDALWGQFICAVELELPEANEAHRALRAGVKFSDPRDVVRAAAYGMHYGLKMAGSFDLAEADRAAELIPVLKDALVISSFQSMYSVMLGLSARYPDALRVSEDFMRTVRKYRLDFALPYVLASRGLACAGLRRWKDSRAALEHAIAISAEKRDAYAHQISFALLTRVLAQQGRAQTAVGMEMPPLQNALRGARAEVIASRALALASVDRASEALATVDAVRGTSTGVESRVLIAAVDAVSALKMKQRSLVDFITALELEAFQTGALDLLVTTYRSTPDLLALLLRASSDRDRLAALIRRAGDQDLAAAVGQSVVLDENPESRLSPREREVYQLLLQGISTQDIAQLLFISPATVKLHIHRIYDKLGLRSRSALLARAAIQGTSHATSAISGESPGES